MLAEALFEQVDALGFREATLQLTDSAVAHGLASVISSALQLAIVGNARGERSLTATSDVQVITGVDG
jgi:hypothetical protein